MSVAFMAMSGYRCMKLDISDHYKNSQKTNISTIISICSILPTCLEVPKYVVWKYKNIIILFLQ